MDIGMLWFDNDHGADLNAKVKRAASYYQKKYGQSPNLCFVHPSMLSTNGNKPGSNSKPQNEAPNKTAGVELRTSNSLLPNHFWLGINHQEASPARWYFHFSIVRPQGFPPHSFMELLELFLGSYALSIGFHHLQMEKTEIWGAGCFSTRTPNFGTIFI